MTDTVIRVDNLGKRYRISPVSNGLGSTLQNTFAPLVRIFRRSAQDEFRWALKNVSFEVKRGEVLGVIGRNGAGKSTLLKILSRITEPTEGGVYIQGRIGSLLEVGTGFHRELTGRENIFMNGTILGMKKIEITQRLEEIVAFAELEKFIDTPIKFYSTGMHLRLGFSVAAHLRQEILLIDEALAVGDLAFQRKCLGKMNDVAKEGRTILFVSHYMPAIRHLCQRGLVFEEGVPVFDGPAAEAVELYTHQMNSDSFSVNNGLCYNNPRPDPNMPLEVLKVEILDEEGQIKARLGTGEYARFRIFWRSEEVIKNGAVELGIHTMEGVPLIQYSTKPISTVDVDFRPGTNCIDCEFPQFPLASGSYNISVGLTRPQVEWLYRDDRFGLLEIAERDLFQSSVPITTSRAFLAIPHQWIRLQDIEETSMKKRKSS